MVVYDGVDLPHKISCGERIVALRTDDPMKGSDLLNEAAKIVASSIQEARTRRRAGAGERSVRHRPPAYGQG